ncbi:Zinc finger protein 711 [Harpegnathos saltator]|uniref:Zinc finger protein 711 n=1 Tax=Harpegnathos saltator TaxID=610380 RepID=E2BAP8_HARSA|nr:Zinc finger protein 711 [Harpegnathos saltator]
MNNYDYTCPQQGCNWAFKVQMDLKNHIKRIHSNKQKKSNSADSGLSLENNPCGEHSSKNGNNAIYRRAPKLCQICNQRFGKSHEMIYHFMNVHGRQLYSCNRCIYETNHKSNYRLHIMRMHENNYDYKCLESGCERKFKMQMDLKRHALRLATVTQLTEVIGAPSRTNDVVGRESSTSDPRKSLSGLNKSRGTRENPAFVDKDEE